MQLWRSRNDNPKSNLLMGGAAGESTAYRDGDPERGAKGWASKHMPLSSGIGSRSSVAGPGSVSISTFIDMSSIP